MNVWSEARRWCSSAGVPGLQCGKWGGKDAGVGSEGPALPKGAAPVTHYTRAEAKGKDQSFSTFPTEHFPEYKPGQTCIEVWLNRWKW